MLSVFISAIPGIFFHVYNNLSDIDVRLFVLLRTFRKQGCIETRSMASHVYLLYCETPHCPLNPMCVRFDPLFTAFTLHTYVYTCIQRLGHRPSVYKGATRCNITSKLADFLYNNTECRNSSAGETQGSLLS